MTQLKCDAIHCLSNRDGQCCRPEIQVGGSHATEHHETCCESFRCITGDAANAVDYSRTNPEMPIHCDATNCTYNHNCECSADNVKVIGHSAKDCEQTSCETFECRSNCCK